MRKGEERKRGGGGGSDGVMTKWSFNRDGGLKEKERERDVFINSLMRGRAR